MREILRRDEFIAEPRAPELDKRWMLPTPADWHRLWTLFGLCRPACFVESLILRRGTRYDDFPCRDARLRF
jgi:hypothetical protein